MNFTRVMLMLLVAAGIVSFVGCSSTMVTNSASNSANKTAANTNATSNASTPAVAADTKTTGSQATPTDAYKMAYDCRQRKDIECLKKVMSQEILDFLVMMGEDENKSLDDSLRELCERPQAPTNESRNEKITGETATIEYPDENGKWQTMEFEKIDGVWKMSPPKGEPKASDKRG